MKSFIVLLSIFIMILIYTPSEAKMGFKKSSGFKSYKNFNYSQPKSIKQNKNQFIQKSYRQRKTIDHKKQKFLNNPIFKWLVGGMIFGALLSFLFGYGFHVGMPGILEIVLVGIVIYFLLKKIKKPSYQEGVLAEKTTLKTNDLQKKKEKEQIDEMFLKNMVSNMYLMLKKEWSKGDLSSIKEYLTDKLYNHLEMQLIDLAEKGLRNVVENINIKSIDIIHIEEKGDKKVVIAEIDAEMIDYIEDGNGNIVSGNKNIPKKVKEYWTIVGKALNWKLNDIKRIED